MVVKIIRLYNKTIVIRGNHIKFNPSKFKGQTHVHENQHHMFNLGKSYGGLAGPIFGPGGPMPGGPIPGGPIGLCPGG